MARIGGRERSRPLGAAPWGSGQPTGNNLRCCFPQQPILQHSQAKCCCTPNAMKQASGPLHASYSSLLVLALARATRSQAGEHGRMHWQLLQLTHELIPVQNF
eukprot:4281160-Amphidinium_carterae.1